ncbi:unnamed protein product, partial [Prorocentrum cordatum]
GKSGVAGISGHSRGLLRPPGAAWGGCLCATRTLPRRDETEEKRPPARGWQRLREGARGYSFRDAREGGMIRVTADAVGRRPCARTQPEPPSLAQHVACTGTLRAPAQRAGAGPKNWPGKPANGTRK